MQDFPRYQNLDLANIISSFLKLNYVPREILAEINQMQNLSFNKYSCLLILESLVFRKYDETFELYDKLFKQLQKNSLNMNPKLVGRTIQVLVEYKQIYKNNKDKNDYISDLSQYYIDRFNESVKNQSQLVESEVLIHILDNVRLLQKLQIETYSRELDTGMFFENCLRLFEDRLDKSKPDTILKSFDKFDDSKLKNRFVASILKSMRENKFDVRRLNFN